MSAISLADFPTFARAARRSRALRLAAAALALAFAALAFAAAPRRATTAARLLPHKATGLVVVDVSASISSDTYARIAATLDRLRRAGGSAGLILFSDTAYQALPPGTPVRELRAFERFFVLRRPSQAGFQPQPPRSPWTDSFSAGTRISTGLDLALAVIREERLRRPLVILVSDLDDDAGDLESLTSVALAYRRLRVPIRVVGLNPSPEDARFVTRLLPRGSDVVQAGVTDERRGEMRSGVPATLVAAGAGLAVALAALLVLTEPLRWARR